MFGKVRQKKVFTRIGSMVLAVVFFATNIAMAVPGYSFAEESAENGESVVAVEEIGALNRVFDDNKIDVWDFGAENLGDAYNNRLDVDTVNGFYDGVEPGSTGVNLTSFSIDGGDFLFNDGGAKTSHRYRTVNELITRYDNKSLKDSEGNVFSGYLYGNKNSNPNVYIALNCRTDDIITVYVASNGGESTVVFENMSDASDSDLTHRHTLGSSTVSKQVYYPKNTAQYRLYSLDEKLVVARVLREHASYANVSGTVSGFNGAGTFNLVFTNRLNGNVLRSTVSEGAFNVTLAKGFDYDISLEGADEYVITSDSCVNVSEDTSLAVAVSSVSLVNVKGNLSGIEAADFDRFVEKAVFAFTPDDPESVYVPRMNLTKGEDSVNFEVVLQANVGYSVSVTGADDYILETKVVNYSEDTAGAVVSFAKKSTFPVAVLPDCEGLDTGALSETVFTFTMLDASNGYADTDYAYSFTGTEGIALRAGQYRVSVDNAPQGYAFEEIYSGDAKIVSEGIELSVPFKAEAVEEEVPYSAKISVGTDKEYKTVGEALDAVRNMNRTAGQRVTVEIDPGDYQEMLVIDVPDVTFKNAAEGASIVPADKGVSINSKSVRITGYYGHGYTYYSMGSDCKYDARLLETNKYNGYASFENPGSGTTAGSYWNATVVVNAAGFEAYDIIFENSFNQYQSELAADDVIVKQAGAKEGAVARTSMNAGDTAVQDKKYVERAAAIAIRAAAVKAYFNHCAFIGRQDTLYGDAGSLEAFYNCDIYGGTDYIFGGMTAVFAKCNLIFNTSEDNNDVGYITAAQQKSADTRGYLMYNCKVTSTEPGVNTASEFTSKPGYLGRPWQANTSEVVFYNTVIDATCDKYKASSASLIQPAGWLSTLGGTSERNVEYGTVELSGEDNSSLRVSWAPVSEEDKTRDGKEITVATFLGDWDPFAANGDDMSIVIPEVEPIPLPAPSDSPEGPVVSVFESKDLTAFAAGTKKDGDTESVGTNDYFTIIYSAKSKVDTSSKTWEDNYASDIRLNLGGKASLDKNAVRFTTTGAASVKVWWVAGDAGRQITVLNAGGEAVAATEVNAVKNSPYISILELTAAGTYYLGGDINNNYIFKIEVTEGEASEAPERTEWDNVAAPVISSVSLSKTDADSVTVDVNALIGFGGGDKLTVNMKDQSGNVVSSRSSSAEKDAFEFTFKPSVSGTYFFDAVLSREDEETVKSGTVSEGFVFTLPLTKPSVKSTVNEGAGRVTLNFYSVSEATSYLLTATDLTDEEAAVKEDVYIPDTVVTNTKTEYGYTFEGLTIGHKYMIEVKALRGDDKSAANGKEITVSEESQIAWAFSAFGSGVNSNPTNCGYSENEDGTVTVWNTGNKGKIVPASTDGLSFYFATVPADKNFTLTATATIDSWTFTNGQEGFGLMACDRVGVNGDSTAFWNNSYMASGTKVEYYYDTIEGHVTDINTAAKITMKNGLGAQEKTGVTLENLSRLEAGDTATVNADFKSKMYTLETSCGPKGVGTYNIWGKETSGSASTVENPLTKVTLRIQKNNTGYYVSVLDEDGNVLNTKKFYDTKALEKLDSEHVYVGFYASRTFKVTYSNIDLKLVSPEDDAPAEDKPVTYVTPNYAIVSAEHSNTEDYTLKYHGNADGVLTITDAQGKELISSRSVKAGAVVSVNTKLVPGKNTFNVRFAPNGDYHPAGDRYQLLSSYEEAIFSHAVTYRTINDAEEIFVSPNGSENGDGTKESPVDIYTAVKFVKPGQTIKLAGGTYSLKETVVVERGIDGTADKSIRMVADSGNRAIFDFNKVCAGFVLAGNYWYISGIDCTNSGNSLKGIQLSGSHCTLKDIRTYENGNTGLQVSRYLSSDKFEDWPSYDLILNCTSYSNADAGYEDADGFAAKLTVGNGIVFDGCISYNNADDGWDLFAKVETGSIGAVTIQNCVAFANGYGVDGKSLGNGNGFKLGGSSLSGRHKLINSVAWGNKSKGIDSNSCPDVEVYHSTSFDNVGANVALYTNDTANTGFKVNGVMSYRCTHKDVSENLKLKGTQNKDAVYGSTNFYWNGGKSVNKDELTVLDSWFVSLEAPYANANNPYAVAAGMRNEDGRINLGNFLKLSEEGITALSKAGMDYKNVLAVLDGNYEALSNQSEIQGFVPNSGNSENTENGNPQGGATQSGSSQSGSSQNAPSEGNTSANESSQGAPSQNTTPHNEVPGRGNDAVTSEETKEEVQNAEGPASESAQAGETQIIEDSETAKSDTAPELVRDDAAEAVAAIPAETKKFPVVPVLVVTGIAAILAAAVAVAAKKGILAKILADLHIVK